jgi:hypothetical protein
MKNLFLALCCVASLGCSAQSFDLQKMWKNGQLEIYEGAQVRPLAESGKTGVSATGIAWLKGVNFSDGVIEVDLRGKDIAQQSFIGIAFHGVDTATYDAVYFRPFNFRSTDSVRRLHAVQYISEPTHGWKKLRAENPGMYEKPIVPPPVPSDWFHARIEVKEGEVKVFVNHDMAPSLVVHELNDRKSGLFGIWNVAEMGDFSNLVIHP